MGSILEKVCIVFLAIGGFIGMYGILSSNMADPDDDGKPIFWITGSIIAAIAYVVLVVDLFIKGQSFFAWALILCVISGFIFYLVFNKSLSDDNDT